MTENSVKEGVRDQVSLISDLFFSGANTFKKGVCKCGGLSQSLVWMNFRMYDFLCPPTCSSTERFREIGIPGVTEGLELVPPEPLTLHVCYCLVTIFRRSTSPQRTGSDLGGRDKGHVPCNLCVTTIKGKNFRQNTKSKVQQGQWRSTVVVYGWVTQSTSKPLL